MAQWEFQRSITSMRLTAEMAVEQGMSLRDCLAGTGVRASQLSDADALVSGQQELRLIRNVVSRLGQRGALGIAAGMRYRVGAYGALGFAIVSSRSMRSALDVVLQHFQLTFAFVRFTLADTPSETRLTVDDGEVPADVAPFVVERAIAILASVGRDLRATGPLLRSLSLRAPPPQDTSRYVRFFGVEPRFGAAANILVFDRARLEQPLLQGNEPARLAAIALCRQLLEARNSRSGLAHTVRSRLVTASARMPTMEAIAAGLAMTPRTLRRHLAEQDTTFAELREEVRQILARELLEGPRLSIGQIAERLGYAETTSFINAYKRWHGSTPHAYRLARIRPAPPETAPAPPAPSRPGPRPASAVRRGR
jgi:AraC-like DNA-binding protein